MPRLATSRIKGMHIGLQIQADRRLLCVAKIHDPVMGHDIYLNEYLFGTLEDALRKLIEKLDAGRKRRVRRR